MEREYTVVANTREDLLQLEEEITASSGAGPIPKRSVDVANPRFGSKIQTHFMLTDEEAELLRQDPRVRAVEIPPDQRDDITIGLNSRQISTWARQAGLNAEWANWGLRRIQATENQNTFNTATELGGTYNFTLDGTGVDVVIQDSGIDPNHPDFFDYNGNSRVQQINWYTESGIAGVQSGNHYRDRDGHGTHCASIAAGLLYGQAKNANIYSQKLAGLETLQGSDGTGISITDAFDCIRLWHNNKNGSRPTVVNMSWGYGANIFDDPDSGVYRGTPWTFGTLAQGADYTDRQTLWQNTGVLDNVFGNFFRIPARVASVDAEIEDMIADGIHICIAAGNNLHKVDVPTGPDYDNQVTFGLDTRFYHRGSSPYSLNAFMVGNIDSATMSVIQFPNIINIDKPAISTTRGPGVNIFAPGTDILAATSTQYDTGSYTTIGYPTNPIYPIMSIGGTSMASPQVCGTVALHLQVKPNLTPAQMQDRIINQDGKPVMVDTFGSTSYTEVNEGLFTGGTATVLYNRYTSDTPLVIEGGVTASIECNNNGSPEQIKTV